MLAYQNHHKAGGGRPLTDVGLHLKQCKRVAKNRLFGVRGAAERECRRHDGGEYAEDKRLCGNTDTLPVQMLISEKGHLNHGRLAVFMLGLFTLIVGIVLSSIPWVDYFIYKNLRLWNDTISFHYWQKPGVTRLTKIYIFNVTNPDGFLNNGEKPRLNEIGPYVYRENMEKVNVVFHKNGTLSFQHRKILHFVPELSVGDPHQKIVVPNIPLLTLSYLSTSLPKLMRLGLSLAIRTMGLKAFVEVTPEELAFGYDDPLVMLANKFFPKHRRPMRLMGLLLGRNGTLSDVYNIFTGHTNMTEFGLYDRLNGRADLPQWKQAPCNTIRHASEGSLFPPKSITKSDLLYVYDKDLCRAIPLRYRSDTAKDGILAGLYTPDDDTLTSAADNPDNKCFCPEDEDCAPEGLQNISPCQYQAPVYLSYPHFYKADPKLLAAVEGLEPSKEKHGTFFKIQPKLGVTLEASVKVQLNLKVEKQSFINAVAKFRSIMFPIIWAEEGVSEVTPEIHRWIYLATTFSDIAVPIFSYGMALVGFFVLACSCARAYRKVIFSKANIERGKEKFRRGSEFIIHNQHRLMIVRESYLLLDPPQPRPLPTADPAAQPCLFAPQ
ncbi:scavenger receptor class B member 1 isoform X1 [Neocloeon triangulifer]|uniref:scavenger receptor class B member 1 isoform X1 n=1 Tax=Neocloeon triangulifer TaxID=2078957 RepID=UPI00286EBDC9|nr:scavenger receptor class B member 1 isoform X1 [Neocloeon triangulifer]